MKKIIKYTLIYIFWNLLIYLGLSFFSIPSQFNIYKWNPDQCAWFMSMGLFFGLIIIVVIVSAYELDKRK